MTTNVELQDLSQRSSKSPVGSGSSESTPVPAAASGPDITSNDERDQSITTWAYASALLLSSFAFVLMFAPGILLFVSEAKDDRRTVLTPLESFLALHGGILLAALALGLLFNIPHDLVLSVQTQKAVGHPLLVPLTSACALSAFISYNTKSVSSLAFIVFVGAAVIGLWGIWTIMFAGSSYHSRKTGADKRTSRFLFGNKAAASSQKKEWKKAQS
ncbi:hypothetical protein EIP91_003803 [Steccherinum ochraceum]|uniref:Transmembrane protein n=1 Tax=Steccherinum ochraceum TaxID=92696 RepID=A0A4R0RD65_9APHY|nr:hypothetical protein EIP91_003803 [Steccherinum ochraceum]